MTLEPGGKGTLAPKQLEVKIGEQDKLKNFTHKGTRAYSGQISVSQLQPFLMSNCQIILKEMTSELR